MVRSHRPGGGRARRIPAWFYWHPCRLSASVASPRPQHCDKRQCASLCTSPTSRRIPAPFCGSALASGSRRISSHLPGSRPPIAPFAAPEWTISIPLRWCGILRGRRSRRGGGPIITGSCCLQPPRLPATSITIYRPDDVLLFGRESAGVPQEVHDCADARLLIPMRPGLRSLNVALAAAMAAGEALRQTRGMPGAGSSD